MKETVIRKICRANDGAGEAADVLMMTIFFSHSCVQVQTDPIDQERSPLYSLVDQWEILILAASSIDSDH